MPLPPRAAAALVAVALRLDGAGVPWLLAGSAARALGGAAVRPGDLDVEVDGADADRAGAALGVALREEAGGGRRSLRGRAVLAGVEVDITAGLEVGGPGGRLAPDFGLQRAWAGGALVAGARVALAPAEEQVARALVAADWPALARIAAQAAAGGAPPPRAGYLARRLASAARAAR